MALNIEKELAVLEKMAVGELRDKYQAVWEESTNSRNRIWLIKRIAWRMQALEYGDLSERARQRAAELARDADIRILPPRERKPTGDGDQRTKTVATTVRASTNLLPGTMIARNYKGKNIRVNVLDDGFEFEGERYKSLSAIAKSVTGQHWNGFHFFGLRKKGTAQ